MRFSINSHVPSGFTENVVPRRISIAGTMMNTPTPDEKVLITCPQIPYFYIENMERTHMYFDFFKHAPFDADMVQKMLEHLKGSKRITMLGIRNMSFADKTALVDFHGLVTMLMPNLQVLYLDNITTGNSEMKSIHNRFLLGLLSSSTHAPLLHTMMFVACGLQEPISNLTVRKSGMPWYPSLKSLSVCDDPICDRGVHGLLTYVFSGECEVRMLQFQNVEMLLDNTLTILLTNRLQQRFIEQLDISHNNVGRLGAFCPIMSRFLTRNNSFLFALDMSNCAFSGNPLRLLLGDISAPGVVNRSIYTLRLLDIGNENICTADTKSEVSRVIDIILATMAQSNDPPESSDGVFVSKGAIKTDADGSVAAMLKTLCDNGPEVCKYISKNILHLSHARMGMHPIHRPFMARVIRCLSNINIPHAGEFADDDVDVDTAYFNRLMATIKSEHGTKTIRMTLDLLSHVIKFDNPIQIGFFGGNSIGMDCTFPLNNGDFVRAYNGFIPDGSAYEVLMGGIGISVVRIERVSHPFSAVTGTYSDVAPKYCKTEIVRKMTISMSKHAILYYSNSTRIFDSRLRSTEYTTCIIYVFGSGAAVYFLPTIIIQENTPLFKNTSNFIYKTPPTSQFSQFSPSLARHLALTPDNRHVFVASNSPSKRSKQTPDAIDQDPVSDSDLFVDLLLISDELKK